MLLSKYVHIRGYSNNYLFKTSGKFLNHKIKIRHDEFSSTLPTRVFTSNTRWVKSNFFIDE